MPPLRPPKPNAVPPAAGAAAAGAAGAGVAAAGAAAAGAPKANPPAGAAGAGAPPAAGAAAAGAAGVGAGAGAAAKVNPPPAAAGAGAGVPPPKVNAISLLGYVSVYVSCGMCRFRQPITFHDKIKCESPYAQRYGDRAQFSIFRSACLPSTRTDPGRRREVQHKGVPTMRRRTAATPFFTSCAPRRREVNGNWTACNGTRLSIVQSERCCCHAAREMAASHCGGCIDRSKQA